MKWQTTVDCEWKFKKKPHGTPDGVKKVLLGSIL